MFLFSSFTGVAFSDMRNLTEQNLSIAEDGVLWVHLKRKKTGTPCNIPLMEIPLQLIEKYRGITKDGKLFPMISCSKTNIHLKRIAMECGIDKRVTFHMARHCYASVVTLSQGVPLETVVLYLSPMFRFAYIELRLTKLTVIAISEIRMDCQSLRRLPLSSQVSRIMGPWLLKILWITDPRDARAYLMYGIESRG